MILDYEDFSRPTSDELMQYDIIVKTLMLGHGPHLKVCKFNLGPSASLRNVCNMCFVTAIQLA
jgi:hypothetical protein